MKGQYAPRYGLSSDEVMIMKAKFQKVRQSGATDWENVDQFCRWAVEEGYKPGMRLRAHCSFEPHSMDNSYFAYPGETQPERHATFIDSESPFCKQCSREECNTMAYGCKSWRDYFMKNWDENICRKGRPAARFAEEVFRYEHPDLVREGILFEGSCCV